MQSMQDLKSKLMSDRIQRLIPEVIIAKAEENKVQQLSAQNLVPGNLQQNEGQPFTIAEVRKEMNCEYPIH